MLNLLGFPAPPRVERPEHLDSHGVGERDLAETFADIARVNRFLGGVGAVRNALAPLVAALPAAPRPVRILDIATGSADIPRALVRIARRGGLGGRKVEIVASDNHPRALELARRLSKEYPEVTVVHADALALPWNDASFDIALCSLALHHLSRPNAVKALREMERVARAGFIVNDLVRERLPYALMWTLTRVVRAHPMTRHDGPLSVLRAFTLPEYGAMAREAGIPTIDVRRVPWFRAVLVRQKQTAGG